MERETTERRRVPSRRSAEEREALIEEYKRSGQSARDFCTQREISLNTFYGWSKKVRERPTQRLAQVETGSLAISLEVLLPNGVRVGVRQSGGVSSLASLIREIGRC